MISLIAMLVKVTAVLTLAGWVFSSLLDKAEKDWIDKRALWIAPVVFVISSLTPNMTVLIAVLFFIMWLYPRDIDEAVRLFPILILSVPYMPYELRLGDAAIIGSSTWASIAAGLLACSFRQTGNRPALGFSATCVAALILMITATLAPSIHGANVTSTLRSIINAVFATFFLIIGFSRANRAHAVSAAILSLAFICFCQAVLGIFSSAMTWPIYDPIPVALDVSGWGVKMRGGMLRVGGVMLDSTYFSVLLAWGLFAIMATWRYFTKTAYAWAALSVVALGMIITTARGGLVAMAIGIVAIPLADRKYGAAVARSVGLAVTYATLSVLSGRLNFAATMSGSTSDTAVTLDYRRRLLDRGWEEIMAHPWFGMDNDTVQIVMNDLRQGEHIIDFVNGYIMVGVYGGVGMMIALLMSFLLPLVYLWRCSPSADPDVATVYRFAFATLAATIVTCLTTGFSGAIVELYLLPLAFAGTLPLRSRAASAASTMRLRAN